jgi:hypothetical protein
MVATFTPTVMRSNPSLSYDPILAQNSSTQLFLSAAVYAPLQLTRKSLLELHLDASFRHLSLSFQYPVGFLPSSDTDTLRRVADTPAFTEDLLLLEVGVTMPVEVGPVVLVTPNELGLLPKLRVRVGYFRADLRTVAVLN